MSGPQYRKGHEHDAAAFWAKFPATVYFTDTSVEVVGVVEALQSEQVKPGEHAPRLLIVLDDGNRVRVTAYQVRLQNELLRERPVVGDRIKIRYLGPADKAGPGRHAAKEFEVRVRRWAELQEAQPQGRPEGTSGKKTATSENVPEVGS